MAVAARNEQLHAGRRIGELFEAHARMVLGLCRLILNDPGEAEDAAQQTFLSAYAALLSGTKPRRPAAWLATIARNECSARLRRRRVAPVPISDPERHAVDGRDAASRAGDRERTKLLAAAIADLPERQRQALVLRDLYGLSTREVADALSAPPGAVEALVVRGRRRVRTALRQARLAPILVPASMRDELARLIPHFDAATAGGVGVLTAAAAKLLAAPAGKVAVGVGAAIVAVGATAEVERARDRPVARPPAAPVVSRAEAPAPAPTEVQAVQSQGEPSRDGAGNSGPGSTSSGSGSDGSGSSNSGPGSASSGSGSGDSGSSNFGSSNSGPSGGDPSTGEQEDRSGSNSGSG